MILVPFKFRFAWPDKFPTTPELNPNSLQFRQFEFWFFFFHFPLGKKDANFKFDNFFFAEIGNFKDFKFCQKYWIKILKIFSVKYAKFEHFLVLHFKIKMFVSNIAFFAISWKVVANFFYSSQTANLRSFLWVKSLLEKKKKSVKCRIFFLSAYAAKGQKFSISRNFFIISRDEKSIISRIEIFHLR